MTTYPVPWPLDAGVAVKLERVEGVLAAVKCQPADPARVGVTVARITARMGAEVLGSRVRPVETPGSAEAEADAEALARILELLDEAAGQAHGLADEDLALAVAGDLATLASRIRLRLEVLR